MARNATHMLKIHLKRALIDGSGAEGDEMDAKMIWVYSLGLVLNSCKEHAVVWADKACITVRPSIHPSMKNIYISLSLSFVLFFVLFFKDNKVQVERQVAQQQSSLFPNLCYLRIFFFPDAVCASKRFPNSL